MSAGARLGEGTLTLTLALAVTLHVREVRLEQGQQRRHLRLCRRGRGGALGAQADEQRVIPLLR